MYETSDKPVEITNHRLKPDTKPFVSIVCLAYNHESFIRDAIEGFLLQKTSFPVEILIHDDASVDKTADIIREYEARFPNLIKPIYQTENQYSQGNRPGRINRMRAKGKYVALCEGDDYWTDPLKLQKQVDFLERNEEYSMACTNFSMVDENRDLIKKWGWEDGGKREYIDQETILGRFTPQTLTVLLRRDYLNKVDPLLDEYDFPNGDVALFSAITGYGPCYFLNEITGCYRLNMNGIWSKKEISEQLKMRLTTFRNLLNFYSNDKKLRKVIYQRLVVTCRVLAIVSFKKAAFIDAATFLYYYVYYRSLSKADNFFKK